MGQLTNPINTVPPEDDPNSELNVLRREVRQLQAAVRDAALQVATLQEEAITLRKSLASTESELEESLGRENNLRMQLDAQRLKKEHIESTMSAAEALVDSLREMVLEPHATSLDPAPTLPPPQNPSRASRADDLDLLLSRISDNRDTGKPGDGPPERKLVSTIDPERSPDAEISCVHHVRPPFGHVLEDRVVGDTASPAKSPLLAAQRPVDDAVLANPTFLPPLRNAASPPSRHRHSMPISRSPRTNVAKPRQPSTLLLSAFGTGNVSSANQGNAIRSTSGQPGDELPVEIVGLAKGEEGVRRGTCRVPCGIRSMVNDAHSGEIYAIASSDDGKWIASAGDDKVIKVYDSGGSAFGSISELTRCATGLAFSGEMIYAGSSDGSVRSFRKPGKRRAKWSVGSMYPVHSQTVRKVMLTDTNGCRTKSGNVVLTCSTDRTIRISDVESGRRWFSVTSASAVLDVDSFGGNGRGMMVSGHKDGGVRVWSTQEEKWNISGGKIHGKGVISICCLNDGFGVVSVGRDNVLRHCDIRNGISVVQELEDCCIETVCDWHRIDICNGYVGCGIGRNGEIGIWNVETGKVVRKISCHDDGDSNNDVLDMMARKLRTNVGSIMTPHWTSCGQLVCGHRTGQVSFWTS